MKAKRERRRRKGTKQGKGRELAKELSRKKGRNWKQVFKIIGFSSQEQERKKGKNGELQWRR